FGLACNHFLGRIPVRPFLHVVDRRNARPAETLPSDTDAVTDRPSPALHEVKEVILRIDHDRAGWFVCGIVNGLAQVFRIDVRQSDRRNGKWLARNGRIKGGESGSLGFVEGCDGGGARCGTRRSRLDLRCYCPWLDRRVAPILLRGSLVRILLRVSL